MKMGLLVFMRNLLLALCLFLVLGFLYYSAWKLHLLRWEDSSQVTKVTSPEQIKRFYKRHRTEFKEDQKGPSDVPTAEDSSTDRNWETVIKKMELRRKKI